MKIAVIGAGVSGLVAARRLTRQGHDVSVFEAGDRWGGHAQAVSLEAAADPVEVGFLVFNQAACPCLTRLLAELNVPTRQFRTAYEVRHPESELVLRGGSLRDLLSVPSNLAVPAFYRVVPDWIRFSRRARRLLRRGQLVTATLGAFLKDGRFSAAFAEQFAYPLAGAVYPRRGESLAETPLASLLGFLHNHALLKLSRGSSCRTVIGGSRGYLRRLTEEFRSRIHLNCPVAAIARNDNYVLLKFPHRSRERFDRVVLAVHADAALRLLADPTRHEREVLECFDYAPQNVYLHDEAVRQGPSSGASAIWRFQPAAGGQAGASLSYRVAQLQDVDAPHSLMLTAVGADQPPPPHVLRTIRFRRPVFSAESLLAQRRFRLINGRRRTFFCGSYWGHGFHEDAVRSAEEVADMLSLAAAEPLTV